MPAKKWVLWIDREGNISPRRKSPKRPTACAILPELYGLKDLLLTPGLSFCVLLLEAEDYRMREGSVKFDRLPVDLLDEVWLKTPEDYGQLVPESLPEEFTAKLFGKAAGLTVKQAGVAVNVLYSVGALQRVGKVKNAYLYRRAA